MQMKQMPGKKGTSMPRFSRRGFLRLSALGLSGAVLVACGVHETPTPLSTSQPARPNPPVPTPQDSLQAIPTARSQTPSARQTPGARRMPQADRTLSNNRDSVATQDLTFNIPAHPVDVILGRPTQRSITASVLAYQEMEGYIEFGAQRGVQARKTPIHRFTNTMLEYVHARNNPRRR
jgi:hypothetical protein